MVYLHGSLAFYVVYRCLRIPHACGIPRPEPGPLGVQLPVHPAAVKPIREINPAHTLNLFFIVKCLRHILFSSYPLGKNLLRLLPVYLEGYYIIRSELPFQPSCQHHRIMAVIAESRCSGFVRHNLGSAAGAGIKNRLCPSTARFPALLFPAVLSLESRFLVFRFPAHQFLTQTFQFLLGKIRQAVFAVVFL